jgi:AcrR family transcriptional regulator
VRLRRQRRRLLAAAATVFAREGYADATAEAIAREAGMSKATFYEHFANKEEAILALFDDVADGLQRNLVEVVRNAPQDPVERTRAGLRAFLAALAAFPAESQTLLVESVGVGPSAAERRDKLFQRFADVIAAENKRAADMYDNVPRYKTEHDTYALVGGIIELASRQLRLGIPEDPQELAPVMERLILGLLSQS